MQAELDSTIYSTSQMMHLLNVGILLLGMYFAFKRTQLTQAERANIVDLEHQIEMHPFLHCSDSKISAKNRSTFVD